MPQDFGDETQEVIDSLLALNFGKKDLLNNKKEILEQLIYEFDTDNINLIGE